MTPREPDRFDKLREHPIFRYVPPEARETVADLLAAALRQAADEALERAAQVAKQSQEDCFCKDKSDEKLGGMPCAACMEAARIEGTLHGLAHRALASPAAAPAWTPPRDAMTGMTAAEEMRAAGIDVLRGVRPAAAPAGQPGTCANFWHPGNGHEIHARREAVGDLSAVHADYVNDAGCLNWKPAAAPAAEMERITDHVFREGRWGGCYSCSFPASLHAPPSGPVAPEKKPFACGADMESDGHLYRCDRGAGHTGSHGERDYAEWTDAEHHDGEPVAPSLLPRVLAALESRPDGYVLHCLVLELRRYITDRQDGCHHGDKGHPCALPRVQELEALLDEVDWALSHLGTRPGSPTDMIKRKIARRKETK